MIGTNYYQKVFAINITTGQTVNSFTLGSAAVGGTLPQSPGNTPDAVNGTITFNAGSQLQRPGLTILNGVVYIGYGSFGNFDPYHGWVLGFSESSLALTAVYNDVPNEIPGQPNLAARAEGSIWQSGAELTTDGTSLFVVTGNGIFDSDPSVNDYGESAIRLLPTSTTAASPTATGYGLAVADFFAPSNANVLGPFQNDGDLDLGTSGAVLLPTQPGSVPNEELLVSKEGVAYLLNRDNLGGNNPTDQIVQELSLNGHGMWGNPTYYNGNIYFHDQGVVVEEYSLSAASTSPAILSLSRSPAELSPSEAKARRRSFPPTTARMASSGKSITVDPGADCTPTTRRRSRRFIPTVPAPCSISPFRPSRTDRSTLRGPDSSLFMA